MSADDGAMGRYVPATGHCRCANLHTDSQRHRGWQKEIPAIFTLSVGRKLPDTALQNKPGAEILHVGAHHIQIVPMADILLLVQHGDTLRWWTVRCPPASLPDPWHLAASFGGFCLASVRRSTAGQFLVSPAQVSSPKRHTGRADTIRQNRPGLMRTNHRLTGAPELAVPHG